MKGVLYLILSVLIVLVNSCTSKDPKVIDVSGVNIDLKLERIDNVLFESNLEQLKGANQSLLNKYGEFYKVYLRYMIKLGMASDPEIAIRLNEFVSNRDMRDVYDEINTVFGDFSELEKELTSCFRYYKYYFPNDKLPKIVIYHSGFNYGVFPADSIIGIGAEMYLGTDNKIGKLLPPDTYPEFIKNKMDPKYIAVDLMEAWISNKFYTDERFGRSFLSQIIFYGKMRYLIETMMPNKSDEILMKYSKEQIDWCIENERNIWTEIVDSKLLYSTSDREINKFTSDGPFTTGLPKESPSRVGKWLGWQMVRGYIKENPKTKPLELVNLDPRVILKYYKPNK